MRIVAVAEDADVDSITHGAAHNSVPGASDMHVVNKHRCGQNTHLHQNKSS